MLAAIISDIHDNLVNLKKCLDWCRQNKIEALICCGDVTDGETLDFMAKNFSGPLHLVKGNICLFDETAAAMRPNINYYGRTGRIVLGNKAVGLCHEPFLVDYALKKGPCDIVFYGHTHVPWIEHREKTLIVNPGTLSGGSSKATFAVWDTAKEEPTLLILEKI